MIDNDTRIVFGHAVIAYSGALDMHHLRVSLLIMIKYAMGMLVCLIRLHARHVGRGTQYLKLLALLNTPAAIQLNNFMAVLPHQDIHGEGTCPRTADIHYNRGCGLKLHSKLSAASGLNPGPADYWRHLQFKFVAVISTPNHLW